MNSFGNFGGMYLGPLPNAVPSGHGISATIAPDLTGIATGAALLAAACLLGAAFSWWRKRATRHRRGHAGSVAAHQRGFSTAATGVPR